MKYPLALAVVASLACSSVAVSAPYVNKFNNATDDDALTVDRYATATKEAGVTFLGEKVLELGTSTADSTLNRPSGFNGIFYDTQGWSPGSGLPLDLATRGQVDFYVDSAFAVQERRTGELWGVGVNALDAIVSYAILGFTSEGTDRFQGYSSATGTWVDLAGGGAVTYDAWYTYSYELSGTDWLYSVTNRGNPGQVWSGQVAALGAVGTKNFILQTVNKSPNSGPNGVNALHRFDNAVHGAVPEPGAWALMILGFGAAGGMLRHRNRRLLAA